MKKFLLILFSLFAFLSCATHYGVYHKVKKNETLYGIAKLYGTSVDKLEKNNNIPDAKKIKPGDYIFIPGASAPLESHGKAEAAPSNSKKDEHKDVKNTRPKGKSSGKSQGKPKAARPAAKPARQLKPGVYGWPVNGGVVTSPFGIRGKRQHNGIDIGSPEGTPVYAAADGKVVFSSKNGDYGLLVVIQHSDNSFTIYAHNSKNLVKEGMVVKKGKKIAEVGKTGNATGPHLHFEIRIGAKAVDPLLCLPKTVP